MWRVPGLHLHVESDRGTAIFTPLFLNRQSPPATSACTIATRRFRPYHSSLAGFCIPSHLPADSFLSLACATISYSTCAHNTVLQAFS